MATTLDPSRERCLTISELATLMHVSRRTLRDLIHSGELPAYRVGRQLRVDPADIDRLREKVKRHG